MSKRVAIIGAGPSGLAQLRAFKSAEEKGAELITINPKGEEFSETRKMPMTLVLGATEDMLVLREEIFGPILPVIPYDTVEEAVEYVNNRPRPLAFYYFDWNKDRANDILARTHAGGVCINDTMSHVMADDIPFGGIGPSGMGHYHGEEGFQRWVGWGVIAHNLKKIGSTIAARSA